MPLPPIARNTDTTGLKPFTKGVSGNPKGRPPIIRDMKEMAAKHAPEALATLLAICVDEKAPPSARVAAANSLLDRGFGRPAASLDVAVTHSHELHLQALKNLADRARAARDGGAVAAIDRGAVIDVTPTAAESASRVVETVAIEAALGDNDGGSR